MSQKQLTRSNTNRFLTGTIGGIGEYFGWSRDVITFVRILYVILAFGSMGSFILIYLVASWIIPSAGGGQSRYEDRQERYKDRWERKQQRWGDNRGRDFDDQPSRKMKEAEPVKGENDDWSDF